MSYFSFFLIYIKLSKSFILVQRLVENWFLICHSRFFLSLKVNLMKSICKCNFITLITILHILKVLSNCFQLSSMDQTLLLEEAWANLFLLSLAQWSVHIDEGKWLVLFSNNNNINNNNNNINYNNNDYNNNNKRYFYYYISSTKTLKTSRKLF